MKKNLQMVGVYSVIICLLSTGCLDLIGLGGEEAVGTNQAPSAVVTSDNNVVTLEGGSAFVSFDGQDSVDPDGTISSYTWNFGDGTTGTGLTITHTYTNPGNYIVVLFVTDDKGAVGTNDIRLTYITVAYPEISSFESQVQADIAASSSVIQSGTTVDFNGDGSCVLSGTSCDADSVTSWEWDFGDETATGNTTSYTFGASSENALTNYLSSGSYPVTLTVRDNGGSEGSWVKTIRVLPQEQSSGYVNRPDTYTVTSIGDPVTLDPANAYDSASGSIITNAYETLIWYDRDQADVFRPMLATEEPTAFNGLISDDGLEYTFNIRQGVTFHPLCDDKMTLTNCQTDTLDAYDVEYSFRRVLEMDMPGGPAWMLSELLNTTGIEVMGTYQIKFTLMKAAPRFIPILAYSVGAIVSKEYVEPRCSTTYAEECDFLEKDAYGTGPYRFMKWVPDTYVLLQKFDEYWGGWDGKHVSTIYIKKNNDQESRILELLSGDADAVYVEPAHRSKVDGKPGIVTREGLPSFSMTFASFNFDITLEDGNPAATIGGEPRADFFEDVNIRKGFCHAFDYDSFIEDVTDNTAFRPTGPIPLGMIGYYEGSNTQFTFDLDQTAYSFEQAGLYDSGFELTVYYNLGNDVRKNSMLMLENAIEDLSPNFEIVVQGLEWPDFLDKLIEGSIPFFVLGWGPDYADPHNYAHPFLHSQGHYPLHYTGYNNSEIDALIDQAASETDPNIRLDLYMQVAELEHDDPANIWLAQWTGLSFVREWVKGLYSNPMHGLYYYSIWKE